MAPQRVLRKRVVARKSVGGRKPSFFPGVVQLKATFGSVMNPIILSPQPLCKEDDTTEGEMTSLSGSSISSSHTMETFSKEDRLGDPWVAGEYPNQRPFDFVIVKFAGHMLYEEKKQLSVYLEEHLQLMGMENCIGIYTSYILSVRNNI